MTINNKAITTVNDTITTNNVVLSVMKPESSALPVLIKKYISIKY